MPLEQSQEVSSGGLPLEALGENPFLASSRFGGAPGIPWLVATSFLKGWEGVLLFLVIRVTSSILTTTDG
jgi:hypothetical protein